MNNGAIQDIKLYKQQSTPIIEDFHGFLTADNITLKMLKRAKTCAANNSKIIWIEGESGTGKHLLARGIIQQYIAHKHATSPYLTQINEAQFNENGEYQLKNALLVPIMQDLSKNCLIKLQQQLINIMRQPNNAASLIIILTYPSSSYSSSAIKQISNMRQIFINQQYEYMLLQPLRNRIHDIELLIAHYFSQFQQMLNIPPHMRLAETIAENMDILLNHAWQYNVKELQQYCLLTCQMAGEQQQLRRDFVIQSLNIFNDKANNNMAQFKRPQLMLINNHDTARNNMTEMNLSLLNHDGSMKQFVELEHEIISKTCRYYRGSKSTAAKQLGLGRTTLYRKLNNEDKG